MPGIRAFYDKLPESLRISLRGMLPGRFLRWYAHQKTDVYLISYPKCGRTWLRLMIGKTIAGYYSLPETEDLLFLRWKDRVHPEVPHITVVHDNRPMLRTSDELETSKIQYKDKKVIFLVRDPRDVVVSSFFEMSKRGDLFGDNPYETQKGVFKGSLQEFIFQKRSGIDTIIRYYNIWADNRSIPAGFLLVRYEDLRSDTASEMRRIMDFLGLQTVSQEAIQSAVAYASFENMRKMETEGYVQDGMLKPADSQDQESYKTRKGKVHGYKDYLSETDIQRINTKIQKDLSSYFGYHNP